MLVTNDDVRRARRNEDGAVLITIVVVMLVGVVIATAIAGSVLFTISANASNEDRTQAFIAAESGRDVAVAGIPNCATSGTEFEDTDPSYEAWVFVADVDGVQPTSSDDLTQGCPTEATDYVVVKSEGKGPDGSKVTIDSVYPWAAPPAQPGGVVTYFSGGFTAGVSHYTGDLVLREGDFKCNGGTTLTGDLYVIDDVGPDFGEVELSNACTIDGDVWSHGHVTNGSQRATITGSITTNSYVTLSANGATSVGKDINAIGEVNLDDQGSDTATVGGKIKSRSDINKGADWTVLGTPEPNMEKIPGFTPTFEPTLDWLKKATKWIDFTHETEWGPEYVGACNLLRNNANPTITDLLEAGGDRLVLDFTSCGGNGHVTIDIALSNVTLSRDAVFVVKPGATMKVDLTGDLTASGGERQLLFVHSDDSVAYDEDADEPVPDCGNGGNGPGMTNDTFKVSGTHTGDVRIMVYSPCGLTGTLTSSFSGQLYTNQSIHLHSTAGIETSYTCKDMDWSPAFDQLSCKIKGSSGIETPSAKKLGTLVYQSERLP